MPAVMNGATSCCVHESAEPRPASFSWNKSSSSSPSGCCSPAPPRRPGKCSSRTLTASRTPKCTLVRSLPLLLSRRARSRASTAPRPKRLESSAAKSTHLRALSWSRRFESPSLSTRCSSRVPRAKRPSACDTVASALAKVARKRSQAASLTGMTLSRMTWWSSWQLSRQAAARPARSPSEGVSSTEVMALRAWERLSHLDDWSDAAIMCP
mmetsp:Transcript_84286/g.220153  ORF Transcript_84286/g.220153 Transcript_84286/m.220153 type:complete len:211 (-) Transcript_84286:186-818(-)